jgi:hypothetical protein
VKGGEMANPNAITIRLTKKQCKELRALDAKVKKSKLDTTAIFAQVYPDAAHEYAKVVWLNAKVSSKVAQIVADYCAA